MLKKITSHAQGLRDWLFQNEPKTEVESASGSRPHVLFFTCIVFYCLYLLVMQPGWVLSGEMWAEMATNYYPSATSSSLAVRFFSTDAGYIPLPQRILAAVGSSINLPATTIPYFYTWSAILFTGGIVGAFCLKPFRAVARNDFLRFFAAIAVLLVADFESRTFINFTYFVAFFTAIITALAFVQKSGDVPWWAWSVPVLMISKPGVLSVLPVMILVSFVGGTRFRLITIAVVLFCLAQALRMFFSHSAGEFVALNSFSFLNKLDASLRYFVGFLGAFFTGKTASVIFYRPILFGFPLLFICLFVLLRRRTNASALIIVGLSLLFFNAALNAFALTDMWNVNMERLAGVPLYRHIIVGYFGVILAVVGLIDTFALHKRVRLKSLSFSLTPVLFLSWFYFSGWFTFSESLNRIPGSPILNNSQWQGMASAIDSGAAICVPIDPLGWVFGRNCALLNPEINWGKEFGYRELPADGAHAMLIEPPASILKSNLMSLAILTKPRTVSSVLVNGEAVLAMKDGSTKHLIGNRQLPISGGLLMLTMSDATPIPIGNIQTVTLKFEVPVEIGFTSKEPGSTLAILWMGR